MKIKKVHPDAVIPQYAYANDSGFDIYATEDVIIEPGETVKVSTGLAVALPDGYELQIRPRSGVTLKTKLRVQLGTIDSTYRGEIGVIVDNIAEEDGLTMMFAQTIDAGLHRTETLFDMNTYIIRKGDRIAQGVLHAVGHTEFEEVDELDETERGQNGFGSTGVSVHGN